MSKVFIEHRDVQYPDKKSEFAPSQHYPEYLWNDVSKEKNDVYDMVRNCLYGYGMDAENFGKPTWNPLGKIINCGDTVVIKPNWVEDKNENTKEGIECLVTNASVIRAVIDYVYIALKNTGKIIIGDSAMPDCDLERLMEKAGYNEIWRSCKKRGINIEIKDFREDITTGFANAVKETAGDSEVIVDLGNESFFAETEQNIGRYRNGIVDATKMNKFYHTKGHHRYGINKTVLSADVIINLPKPKTHRKAGYTAALKNYIGVCSRKISIPHNVTGNIKEGGDTYFGPKIIFGTEGKLRDIETYAMAQGKVKKGNIIKCLRIPFWLFRRMTHKKYFGTGNWYKNDTIWRAILDINRIMIYSDKNGKMMDTPQRKFLSLGDMIIAGHKNGPLAPTAKEVGILLISEDPVAFDMSIIKIMGLNINKLPVLKNIPRIKKYPIKIEKTKVYSNEIDMNAVMLKDMPVAKYGFFIPADGWNCISMNKSIRERGM